MEVAETATSFLACLSTCGIVTFLVTGVTFDVAQVFWRLVLFRYLGSIDPGGWMAFIASPTTILVFFGSLGLRLISRRGGLGLSLVLRGLIAGLSVGVFLLFFC